MNIAIDRKSLKEIPLLVLGTGTPTGIAIAFVPLPNLTTEREEGIRVRSKLHIFETIPIVVIAGWITQIVLVTTPRGPL